MTSEKKKVLFVLDIDKIQDYIFATNKLKTIIGASWILDNINASLTGETLKLLLQNPKYGFKASGVFPSVTADPKFILSGGGNTKLIFEADNAETAHDLAENFEAQITSEYRRLGVSVTTHIQPIDASDITDQAALSAAEKSIAWKKYNKKDICSIAASPFFKICETCGRTYAGWVRGPANDEVILCCTCRDKMDEATEKFRLLPGFAFKTDVDQMDLADDMLAIVVMDGNKMGEKIKLLSLDQLKNFSQETETILSTAFTDCLREHFRDQHSKNEFKSIRPIILGGDDIGFVIAAKYALPFVSSLIAKIEHKSKQDDQATFKEGITFSAGILYIKKNYPFNFAHRIAESLLREAKRSSRKQGDCSMIDFHVLLTSSGDDIEKSRPREYMVGKDRLLTNKPYKNNEIDSLTKDAGKLKKALASNKIKYLRQVLRLDLEASSREIIKILSRLDKDEAKQFKEILEKHGWKMDDEEIWHTGLLDLVEMAEFAE